MKQKTVLANCLKQPWLQKIRRISTELLTTRPVGANCVKNMALKDQEIINMCTALEKLEKQNYERGIQKGKKEGIQEGIKKATALFGQIVTESAKKMFQLITTV